MRRHTEIESPEVAQTAAAHASVDDEVGGAPAVLLAHVHVGRVRLARRWRRAGSRGKLPRQSIVEVGGLQLQYVEIVQVPRVLEVAHELLLYFIIVRKY